jgi:hypothetical protein
MITIDIPVMIIGALLFGMVLWGFYNHTHPQTGQK